MRREVECPDHRTILGCPRRAMNSSIGDRTSPPASIPVAIISVSPTTNSGLAILAQLEQHGHAESPIIDLDRFLPLSLTEESIIADKPGSKLVSQRVAFSQPTIVDVIKRVLIESSGATMDNARIFFRASEHAACAEVVAEREAQMLNTFQHIGPRGTTQVFNAKHFPSLRVPSTQITSFLAGVVQFFELGRRHYTTPIAP